MDLRCGRQGKKIYYGDLHWDPGVNNHGHYGRWAFAEFTEVYRIEADFKAKVEEEFNKRIEEVIKGDG